MSRREPTVPLKEHFDAILALQTKLLDERHQAQLRAVDVAFSARDAATAEALVALNRRLDVLNELRGVVSDQNADFLRKEQYDSDRRYEHTDAQQERNTERRRRVEAGYDRALSHTFSHQDIGHVTPDLHR